jgi:mannose-6-phosphate isomerase-like protein (cupin superfamily)
MAEHIKPFDEQSEYYFKEGCHIIEMSNSDSDEAASIARARVEPGKQTQWHALRDTTERYVILEGEGVVEVGENSPERVTAGDVVIIPANCKQRILNSGDRDLIFLAICTPRFAADKYFSL